MSYMAWNEALARHFFKPEFADQAVHLYVTQDLLDSLGKELGIDASEFPRAVENGPPWVDEGHLCRRALQSLEAWRERNLEYPPYIAFLGLFVLAAGLEGDFAPHAYYPRLRELLGYETGSTLPSFERMIELWDDLEVWSVQDRHGELGIFDARIVGNQIHIGLPLAQTILAEHERAGLPLIFYRASLDPTSLPPEAELLRVLRLYGSDLLRPRTLALASGDGDADLLATLADTVLRELEDWDGRVEVGGIESGPSVQGSLRLCMRVDTVAGRSSCWVRCRLNREFPEQALTLDGSEGEVTCEEEVPGWSSILRLPDGSPLDAAQLNWEEGTTYRASDNGWRFTLSGRPVRILVEGTGEGLPGLVEVHRLPQGEPFYLLFRGEYWDELGPWARDECENFHRRSIQGLPSGWQLASVSAATGDSRIRTAFPNLAFGERPRLRLRGGVRSAAGNNFFAFAPPAIEFEGGSGSEKITCGDHELSQHRGPQLFELPDELAPDTRITVEARENQNVVARRSLYLTGDFAWRFAGPTVLFNEWGVPSEREAQPGAVAGAAVYGIDSVEMPVGAVLLALQQQLSSTGRVFLIGQRVGQIAPWYGGPLPKQWKPIWAVAVARQGTVSYVGGPERCGLLPRAHSCNQRDLRLWKQVLWHWRKRVSPPHQKHLRSLWSEYVRQAQHA